MFVVQRLFPLLLLVSAVCHADQPVIAHDLYLSIDGDQQYFELRDRIVIKESDPNVGPDFPDLSIRAGLRIDSLAFDGNPVEVAAWFEGTTIFVPSGTAEVELRYGGPVDETQWPYLVWLPGDGWYPETQGFRVSFDLTLTVPPGWSALTQGIPVFAEGEGRYRWTQEDPQQGIYLVTGPWYLDSRESGGFRAQVMLMEPDDKLSSAYLDAALVHLERYSEVLGPYPYHQFTLVEDQRQTGWGMPGFTLLGSRIIRLPFIIHTSFPHEILHNWWGNGVYADVSVGNWSEGLTTYLSDYLYRERRGKGRQYRLDQLIAWHDYAARGFDFPLAQFRGRHDRRTQAVGYGKGMFLFHMLRRKLGDERFLAGLRNFFSGYRFRHATFLDIQSVFETACGCPLESFFQQWVNRPGAPSLSIIDATVRYEGADHSVDLELRQDSDPPWSLDVPVTIVDEHGRATTHSVQLGAASRPVEFGLAAAPARVDLDPDFDLFRKLSKEEKPTTLSQFIAAADVTVSSADRGFAAVAEALVDANNGWRAEPDPSSVPSDTEALLLLGRDHPLAVELLTSQPEAPYKIAGSGIVIDGVEYKTSQEQVVVLVDTMTIADQPKTVLWIAANQTAGLLDLVRRLKHYGRSSYAIFGAAEERAKVTGQWRTRSGSLSRVFDASVPGAPAESARPLF